MAALAVFITVTSFLLGVCTGQATTSQPDSNLYAAVQDVGSSDSGTFRAFYGCGDNGATLSSVTLWANAEFVRGMAATLTDGREVVFGCVNVTGTQTGGCNDSNIRTASFVFQPGESVTSLTLWPGYNLQKQPNQRAGAMNMVTSRGRSFDFGMTDTRVNPVNVNIGSGIPCGVAPRAGADIDALGFVFLLPVTSSTLEGVTYQGVSQQQGSAALDTSVLDLNASNIVLSSQVYNNTGKKSALVATFSSSQVVDSPASWSTTNGLDSYLQSRVKAALPIITSNGTEGTTRWGLSTVSTHNRSEAVPATRSWNYTVNVGAGGVSEAVATSTQADITTTYWANLTVVLNSGGRISIPITGTFESEATSPVGIEIKELQLPSGTTASSSTDSDSGSNNTLAWVLGVIFGILGGLIFAALIAWAVVLIVRRRRQSDGSDDVKKVQPGMFFTPGKGNSGSPENIKGGKLDKDIELGAMGAEGGQGKGGSFSLWGAKGMKGSKDNESKWKDQPDPKLDTVMGVPAGDAPGSSSAGPGRYIVPYVTFRRLRLESIRNALGLEGQEEERDAEGRHENEESGYIPPKPPANTTETPQPAPSPIATSDTTPSIAPPTEGAAEALKATQGEPEGEGKTAPVTTSPPPEDSSRAARLWRLKDRVAAVMARRNSETPPPMEGQQGDLAQPATSKGAASHSSDKGSGVFTKLAKSVSSMTSNSSSSKIQHDDHIIDLKRKPSGMTQSAGGEGGSDASADADQKPQTPRRPKTVEHEDKQLKLGEGYEAPADAKSIQKNAIDIDNKRVKLGVKYHTQGRNE